MPPVRLWPRLRPLALIALAAPIWAMSLDAPDVSNFHQVDDHVYRGAQPPAEGWKELAKLGVQVVLDLRLDGELQEHWTRSEREAVEVAGMRYISVPMDGWAKPDGRKIAQALAELARIQTPGFCGLSSGQRPHRHCDRMLSDHSGPLDQ